MLRNRFEITEKTQVSEFLKEQKTGVLTLSDGSGFYSLPINYAWDGEKVVFHASRKGRKATLIRAGNKGQFTVYKEYSVIPSYFFEGSHACHATQFYASVMIVGETGEITDQVQKAAALNCIMDQIQGAGSYTPITDTAEEYAQMISHTAIFCLRVGSSTAKFHAGQDLSDEKADHIIGKLTERGSELDLETAALIREMRRK